METQFELRKLKSRRFRGSREIYHESWQLRGDVWMMAKGLGGVEKCQKMDKNMLSEFRRLVEERLWFYGFD